LRRSDQQAKVYAPAIKNEEMAMQMRQFGRTGFKVSVLGFGCGAVGGLMVRGEAADQERAVARALDAGINYFDTAVQYGNGVSESNLGRILAKLKPEVIVGTKVRLTDADRADIAGAVVRSLEGSLRRLALEQVDIFHLHNEITRDDAGLSLSIKTVLEDVVPAFEKLRQQGKARFIGITAIGDVTALHQAIDAGVFHSAQVSYNMLNPSAGEAVRMGYPAQDYGKLLERATAKGVGTIVIRVLAGGALTGEVQRHPIASPPPEPIGSAFTYNADLQRAGRFRKLVEEGFSDSLAEAATRFAISHQGISTALIGIANQDQFEQAIAAVEKGPLPPAALARVLELQNSLVGEPR
jgi:aryl-alcohol dehydrogenase-like predicted oxidoreductase